MKLKKVMKKLAASLLATAMTASSLTQFITPVSAQDATTNALPDKTQFATVDELKSFNTDDTNDGTKNPAKVYFGNSDQQWWIAGSQQDAGLTLYSANTFLKDIGFAPDIMKDRKYDSSWKCIYPNGEPADVHLNHYGASEARNRLKSTTANDNDAYFSITEKELMNETTVYTYDLKNNDVYSTTDKLYLPYGVSGDTYFTVGANDIQNLNIALRVDLNYWGNSNFSWLRAPGLKEVFGQQPSDFALVTSNSSVTEGIANMESNNLNPAFELNLSSVLFASALLAASTGDLTLQDTDGNGAFTLRYDATKYAQNLGSAFVSYDKNKVTLTNVPNGTYLVAQNSAGAKTKQITNETEVSASDMGLDSFSGCKVWLETTNSTERMTYATLATEEQRYGVNITAGLGLSITSGNGVQEVAPNTAIADITVKVADGYYLPDGYVNNIQGLNGLTIKNASQNGFIISGTPTSDVNLQLPAATIKTYVVNVTASTGLSIISNNGVQKVAPNTAIADVTVEVVEGYYLPEDYANNIQGLNGLTIKDATQNGFTISGTPKSDVNLQLPAATKKYVVNVTAGDTLTVQNGTQSIEPGKAITDITVEVADGYYLPDGYINNIQSLNGLTAKQSGTGFTISGTPNGDVNIALTDATKKYVVNITAGDGLTVQNGTQSIELGKAIADITVEVTDGYYLPDGYLIDLQSKLNGLTVKQSSTGFTISGTPTGEVNITLPAATPKEDQQFPTDVKLSGTGGSGTGIYGTTTAMEYRVFTPITKMREANDASEWKDCQDQFTPVEPGTYEVRYKETETKNASDSVTVVVTAPTTGSGSGGGGSTQEVKPVYRAYNPNNGEHLYTLDEKEYKHVSSIGWTAEGVAFMAETEKEGQALYRVYNPNDGLHHYTLDENEKNILVSLGWRDEKVAWYTNKKPQSAPVYRVYNPNDGNHHYTMNKHERDVLVSLGWHDEGIAFRTAPIETK